MTTTTNRGRTAYFIARAWPNGRGIRTDDAARQALKGTEHP